MTSAERHEEERRREVWAQEQSTEQLLQPVRAFSTYFHLINVAEQHHRVRTLREQSELLESSSVLTRSIKLRNPYVIALHIAQIALLRRYRALAADASPETRAALLDAIYHSINGIAAGLQRTD